MCPTRIRDNKMENFDLSKATREDLCKLLSTAKNEWRKYVNCEKEVKYCKKHIEEEKNKMKDVKDQRNIMPVAIIIIIVGGCYGFYKSGAADSFEGILTCVVLLAICVFAMWLSWYRKAKSEKKTALNNLNRYELQLSESQKKEAEAKNELNEILIIPLKYWDEYALTTMLQYITDFEASNWERVTDLYKESEYRRMMIENAQMSLEEARRQTEIALQTRNAARMAAFGSLVSAAGILRINSKL